MTDFSIKMTGEDVAVYLSESPKIKEYLKRNFFNDCKIDMDFSAINSRGRLTFVLDFRKVESCAK